MTHPLVDQLRFARSEFVRGLADVRGSEAQRRFGKMNCISWIVGHLAWQEQRYWLYRAQGQVLIPKLNEFLAYGKPACTPDAEEMWSSWRQVTQAADPWLDTLTTESLQAPLTEGFSSVGTFMLRNTYHYWYHLGEGMAIRQLLEQANLPEYVGDIDSLAPYRPDSGESTVDRVDKQQFIRNVRETREKLDALIAQVDEDRMLQPLDGSKWSVKDIIAHITWHEREVLAVLKARKLVGSDLWNLPLDERNQAIYEQYKDLPLGNVLSDARDVYQQMIGELEKLTEEDLNEPDRFADMPPGWRISNLFRENTYQHYADHLLELSVVLKGNS